MFTNIEAAIDFIENQRANSATLEDFAKVFEKYANFQNKLDYIHITGTNGKGSTSKMINDSLINANYKVGLFTSPHIVVSNDRIRINNNYISDEQLLKYVNKFYDDILNFKLNFFQIYTLIAFAYFYDEQCDIAIIEVGIGGLLDSTNIIDGLVSVITNINFDHTERLGERMVDIAYQKSGIIKKNKHTVTMVDDEAALKVIKDVAKQNDNKLLKVENNCDIRVNDNSSSFEYKNEKYTLNSLAKYQVSNSLLAIETLNILSNEYDYHVEHKHIDDAFKVFNWFGRYEIIQSNPKIIIDGAHNIAGIKSLIKSSPKDMVVIFSALADKDYNEMLELLKNHFREVVFAKFDFYRALNIEDISGVKKFDSFNDALVYVEKEYANNDILVCGSLYFISEVRKILKGD